MGIPAMTMRRAAGAMKVAAGASWFTILLPILFGACSGDTEPGAGRGPGPPGPTVQRMVEVVETTAEFENGSIRYLEAGRGPAVLFLHGMGGNSDQWRHQIQPVAVRGWRVLVPDLPGTRDSHFTIPGFDGKDVSVQAELLVGFLDRLKLPDVHLVGHSWGGLVAQRLVINSPDRVASLVLVDTAVNPLEVDALAGIECPTLIVWAENDAISPLGIGRSLSELIPEAEFHVIEDVGVDVDPRSDPVASHVPPLYAPEEFNRRLLEFLAARR